MKIRIRLLLCVFLSLTLTGCTINISFTNPEQDTKNADEQNISEIPEDDTKEVSAVILHTNDVHVGFEDNIGYDGLALYKKELEKQYDHVLLVDAGDAIQGAPLGAISKGKEVIKMMNLIGYDLAVPGNHEFDFGFDELDDRAQELDRGSTKAGRSCF